MKNFMAIAALLFAQSFQAHALEDSIHSIVKGTNGEPHLVKYNSGRVEFVEASEEQKLTRFEALKARTEAKSLKSLTEAEAVMEETFAPTPVADKEIQNIFNRMNPHMRRRSECSDRAHVWAWDEFQKSGTKSEKAFLFLTDTYIKRTRYKWWFHVAPLFTTTSGQKMLLDYQFLDRPVKLNEWKNTLVFSQRDCVLDFKFNDYNAGADQTQDCYMKTESMYYRLPTDIGAKENGTPRTQWNNGEVNGARSRAFSQGSI